MDTITRFAPSPTGDLHIGGVRTALYSWLSARQKQGQFRLRIEDTDTERSTERSTRVILEGMEWLGLDHDGEIVYQSQRFAVYNQIIEEMLARGQAYYCWCTAEELEQMRAEQQARGEKPRYNGKYRNGGDPVPGVTPVVRFKNPQTGSVAWDDRVRGPIVINNEELDDWIIRRSDGAPTYNFCVVIDDAEAGVNLVVRGEDHVSNTPKQINLYNALGLPVPDFAHVPMILGEDGSRLSKRHGATNVLDYRKLGYLPQALLNYLVRLGWSHGDQEMFSREELLEYFSIDAVNSAPAKFNEAKLKWFNQQYLIASLPEALLEPLLEQFAQIWPPERAALIDRDLLRRAIPHYQERAQTLREMALNMAWIFGDLNGYGQFDARDDNGQIKGKSAVEKAFKPESAELLADLRQRLAALADFSEGAIHEALEACVAARGVGFGKLGQPARLAITGGAPSPDLALTMYLAGRDRCLQRLDQAVAFIKEQMPG